MEKEREGHGVRSKRCDAGVFDLVEESGRVAPRSQFHVHTAKWDNLVNPGALGKEALGIFPWHIAWPPPCK